jgi:uncharacterized protein YqhQ
MENELIDVHSDIKKLPHQNAVLVLGIISIVGSLIYGIPGLICGIIGFSLSGRGMAIPETAENAKSREILNAGRICSIIGIIFSVIMTLIYAYVIFIIVQYANARSPY